MMGFHVHRRNPGHWDIIQNGSRAFCIRGGPGHYYIRDERKDGLRNDAFHKAAFKTVTACMVLICEELMFELIVAQGQTAIQIEGWNVPQVGSPERL
jgi:hypothetical protein